MARTAFAFKKSVKKTPLAKKSPTKTPVLPPSPSPSKKSLPPKKPLLTKSARKRSLSVKKPIIVTPSIFKTKPRRRSAVLTQIKYFQNYTNLLVSKLPFSRLVRQIIQGLSKNAKIYRFSRNALLALQEAFEAFIVTLFENGNMCAAHAKRVTLFEKDINLVKKLTNQ